MQTVVVGDPVGDHKDWEGEYAYGTHGTTRVTAPFEIVTQSGELVAFGRKIKELRPLHKMLSGLHYGTSRRSNGMISHSAVFGYMPSDLRIPFTRAAAFCTRHPEVSAHLEAVGKALEGHLLERKPEQYAAQREMVAKINPLWRMQNELYTSGIINFNNRLVYHKDRGNFVGSWNSMIVLRKGASGGDLVLPQYNITIAFDDCVAVWMNAQDIVHGVTPIVANTPTGYRMSVVWYAMKGLLNSEDSIAATIDKASKRKLKTAISRHSRNIAAFNATVRAGKDSLEPMPAGARKRSKRDGSNPMPGARFKRGKIERDARKAAKEKTA
jgi:hypothetical protein